MLSLIYLTHDISNQRFFKYSPFKNYFNILENETEEKFKNET